MKRAALCIGLLLLTLTVMCTHAAEESTANPELQQPPEEPATLTECDRQACPYAKAKGYADPFRALHDHFQKVERIFNHWDEAFAFPRMGGNLLAAPYHHPHHETGQVAPRRSWWNSVVPAFDFHRDSLWPVARKEEQLWHPVVDVSETDKHIVVHAELPGVNKEDIEVSLDGNTLTLSGERKSGTEEEDKDKRWHRVERSYGRFVRSMKLPENVDMKNIEASHNNGVLEIEIPKLEVSPTAKTQKVSVK